MQSDFNRFSFFFVRDRVIHVRGWCRHGDGVSSPKSLRCPTFLSDWRANQGNIETHVFIVEHMLNSPNISQTAVSNLTSNTLTTLAFFVFFVFIHT